MNSLEIRKLKQQKLDWIRENYNKYSRQVLTQKIINKFGCCRTSANDLIRQVEVKIKEIEKHNAELEEDEKLLEPETPKIFIDDSSYFENSFNWKRG